MNKLVFDAIQTCKASTKQNRKNFAKTKRQFWQIISQIRFDFVIPKNNFYWSYGGLVGVIRLTYRKSLYFMIYQNIAQDMPKNGHDFCIFRKLFF